METLTVSKNAVLHSYRSAKGETRALLQNLFGKQVYDKITDRVKSFEDACDVLEYSNITPVFAQLPDKYHSPIKSFYIIQVISEALNEGWVADLNCTDQVKYFPYFKLVNGKLVFRGVAARDSIDALLGVAASAVVSRLCFHSEELAEYAGKQFIDLYSDYILPTF